MSVATVSASELQSKTAFEHLEMTVEHDEDEALNIDIYDGTPGVLFVTRVNEQSFLFGKVQAGDYIISVNGRIFKNKSDMFKIALASHPHLRLSLARPKGHHPIGPSVARSTMYGHTPSSLPPSSTSQSPSSSAGSTMYGAPTPDKAAASPAGSTMYSAPKPRDPKQLAGSHGFDVKADREYLLIQVSTSTSGGKHLGLGITHTNKEGGAVVVSSVQPNSVASDFFKAGDRFLTIHDQKMSDIESCRKAIIERKGDFEALIERPLGGLATFGLEKSTYHHHHHHHHHALKSSYTPPTRGNPDHHLGQPLIGYEAAPADVQFIINRQMDALMSSFKAGIARSQRDSSVSKSDDSRVKMEHEVTEHSIESDVAPGAPLRKPPKRG